MDINGVNYDFKISCADTVEGFVFHILIEGSIVTRLHLNLLEIANLETALHNFKKELTKGEPCHLCHNTRSVLCFHRSA
jgi:hypothetical protein